MKNTAFTAWIRKLGVKKFALLSIFALVALAYIVTPLIALACDGNNNNNGGGNSSSDGKNNSLKNPTPTPGPRRKRPPKTNSTLIDSGILLINKQSIQKTNIAFLQVVGPDHKALTLSQYQQLVQYAATPGKAAVLVRVEMALFNQPILNGVFTQGQFLTKLVNNKPIGELIVTTDNKQKLVASPTTPIPLRIPGSTAKQQLNGTRRTQ
ncbi:MAG TPA: hypothetical protein VGL94_20845 [Ktedonobacteraceae bacterium]|jgi:hypothetical protein